MGGKHRRLLGVADMFVDDTIESFRLAALHLNSPLVTVRHRRVGIGATYA